MIKRRLNFSPKEVIIEWKSDDRLIIALIYKINRAECKITIVFENY
jgi:hypothetical protein